MAHMHAYTRRLLVITLSGIICLSSGGAHAAGFFLIEQSVSSMGTAYAGAGSASEDASYIFFNPASMSKLKGIQVSAGLHGVFPETEFDGSAAYNLDYFGPPTPPLPPQPGPPFPNISGPSSDIDAGVNGYVPHFAYVQELNDRMHVGVTINVPFGLSTDYGNNWVGRYSSTEAEILSVNLNPTLSYKVDDRITLGVGVSAIYAEFDYKNVLDAGYSVGAPGLGDANSEIDTDDYGFGWNIGLLLEPTDSTRIGIAYRSKVEINLDGDLESSVLDTSAEVDADLPDTFLISAYHEVNPQWAVMADVLWTQWSRIDALDIELGNGTTNTFPLEWDDTYRVAVGASYKPNEKLILRGGVAYDETPIPTDRLRLTALPDEDRIWVTVGAGYKVTKNLSLDFGYAHLFVDDTDINSTSAVSSAVPFSEGLHRVKGEYEASVDIVSAQLNWAFN